MATDLPDAPERVTVCDGKYTVINDHGKLTAERNGEPWQINLTGNNLVYWMMVEIQNLRELAQKVVQAYHADYGLLGGTINDQISQLEARAQEPPK